MLAHLHQGVVTLLLPLQGVVYHRHHQPLEPKLLLPPLLFQLQLLLPCTMLLLLLLLLLLQLHQPLPHKSTSLHLQQVFLLS
jgi:hypothetical protein